MKDSLEARQGVPSCSLLANARELIYLCVVAIIHGPRVQNHVRMLFSADTSYGRQYHYSRTSPVTRKTRSRRNLAGKIERECLRDNDTFVSR